MPTARELLEQADALMRRNRRRDRDKPGGPPTLTDARGSDREETLAPTVFLPDAVREVADASAPDATADPISLDTLSDVPVLTDVVDVWPAGETPDAFVDGHAQFESDRAPVKAGTLDEALEADALASRVPDSEDAFPMRAAPADVVSDDAALTARDEPTARDDSTAGDESTGRSNAAGDAARPMALTALDEEFILDIPPPSELHTAALERDATRHDASSSAPAAFVAPGSPDWNAMAEEIRMQVLQRLDLFTDTGMRDQLGARLQPIVDRASAELVETINHQLGELVRGYVAEAIEREIESWRKRSG
ncbi:MAG TPA: hypothetical protein VHL33_03220 [Casimicrobiaceae bacterium]|nr:hypothetical protein [Casimicrobiaceae bacterium]